jgi:hypothetical protein
VAVPIADPDKRRAADRDRKRTHRAAGKLELIRALEEAPEPPDRETLLRILGVRAREGHVPSIRLLLAEYRRDARGGEGTGSVIDVLAKRRAGS